MSETTTVVRLLKFISLLASPYRRTVREYATYFQVDRTTIGRYCSKLEEVGYLIHKDEHYQLYVDKPNPRLDAHLHFDEDETQLLSEMLKASTSPGKKDLLNKIYFNSSLPQLAASTAEAQLAKRYRLLRDAIQEGQQVVLLGYTSMNGSKKKDRKVEPIRFIRDNQHVEAFEVESQATKHFQLDRMADVRQLHVPSQHTARHQQKSTDPFYIADVVQVEIQLEMSPRAGQRMKEDFPEVAAYQQTEQDKIIYNGPVNKRYLHLDRWLMGWCDEVRILQPESLRRHLEKRWSERKL